MTLPSVSVTRDDAPLDPEHWERVHHSLFYLYLGLCLGLVPTLSLIGWIFTILGHRGLMQHGPTRRVRAMSRFRLVLRVLPIALLIVALAAAFDSTVLLFAFSIAFLTTLLDYPLWVIVGKELAEWSSSEALIGEWGTVGRRTAVGAVAFLITLVVSIGLATTSTTWLVLVVLFSPLVLMMPIAPLLFTSWRTYRLFSRQLVAAYAAVAPPPPVGPPGA